MTDVPAGGSSIFGRALNIDDRTQLKPSRKLLNFKFQLCLCRKENFRYLCATLKGRLAEWLGSGLQNRVRRFESAIDLNKSRRARSLGFFALSRRQLAERRGKAKNPTAVRAPLGLVDRTPKTGSLKVIRHHIQQKSLLEKSTRLFINHIRLSCFFTAEHEDN